MLRKNIVGLLICIVALGATSLGFAGIPDIEQCTAEMLGVDPGDTGPWNVFNTPDATGYTMAEARAVATASGSWDDATITVTLIDGNGNPVFAYPFEDLWLENTPATAPVSVGDPAGLVACPNGTLADASSDINGQTTFSGPFFAGGHVTYTDATTYDATYVMVSGEAIATALPIIFNSADIDGDGQWTSSVDVILFSQRYPASAGYSYSVDFYFDEANTLSDLVLFSAARNVACP